MKKEESKLENDCCLFARAQGIASVKIEKNGNVGIPDRLFVWRGGKTIFVEFKKPGGKGVISDIQQFWAEFIGKENHFFIDNYETFKIIMKNNG